MNLLLTFLFFLSGLAALVYEVAWLHLLRLSIGNSTYSLAVILSVFMGGMGLGSLLAATPIARARHPLRVYAALEIGLAGCGLAVPYLLAGANDIYVSTYSWHGGSVLMRALLGSAVLLPPTAMMGATLPIVSRWVGRDSQGAARIGRLYGANIFGAVAGSLLAGVVLVQHFDVPTASHVAATINLLVGLVAWRVAARPSAESAAAFATIDQAIPPGHDGSGYAGCRLGAAMAVLFLSGFAALGAEVVWTRLLTLSLGPTVYTFSLVLAVFLLGLGSGSWIGSALVGRVGSPLLALGTCQVALIATITLAANSFSEQSLLPRSFWMLSFTSEWPATLRDLTRCLVTVFPSACFWGTSFPLAVATTLMNRDEQARSVGLLLGANTFGAITGAVSVTLVLVPRFGTQGAQQALIVASTAAACCCLFGHLQNSGRGSQARRLVMGMAAVLACGKFGATNVLSPSPALFAYGREAAQRRRDAPYEIVREGVHTPIVVTHWPQHGNIRALHLAGKLEASDDKIDLRLERMLGHIPQFLCDDPKSVLVVGLGAGITAGTFVMDSRLQDLTICELEPALPAITAEYFAKANRNVLSDPRTQLVIDDGRHFLQTTKGMFDVISVDPIHPWVRGAAALYSEEFFRECLEHLEPGGAVSYWVPMHSMTVDSVKSEIATFCLVFPHALVWHTGGTILQRHMLLVGSNQPLTLDLNKIDDFMRSTGEIEESIEEMEFRSVDELLSLYVANKDTLSDWMRDAAINSDMNLKLEYLAGAAAYQNNREAIFRDITAHRTWPRDLFRGDPTRLEAIRENLDSFDTLEEAVPKR